MDQIRLQAAVVQMDEEGVEVFEGGADEGPPIVGSRIENVHITQQYIQGISSATLDNGTLDEEVVDWLRNY